MISRLVVLGAVAVILGACGPARPDGSTELEATSPAAQELDCGGPGYPCSPGAADPAVTKQTEDLAGMASDRLEQGVSADDVVAFLKTQQGVVEADADGGAIRFRLDGGRPVWVADDPTIGLAAGLESTSTAGGGDMELTAFHGIVGPTVAAKHARVLSAVAWDFGASDDGPLVSSMLKQTRGYAGGVTLEQNAKPADKNVDIDDFKGWSDLQVVHVVSHGVRICKQGACRAVIIVRLLSGTVGGTTVGGRGFELDPKAGPQTGVEILHSLRPRLSWLALDADFFRKEYPGGVHDTFVFFNACETLGPQATDLANAIRGGHGEFAGWTEVVDSDAALKAAQALYERLKVGRTGGEAIADIGDLATDPGLRHAQLVVSPPPGTDLRIRDVVTAEDPANSADLVPDGAVAIDGTMADGQLDAVPWKVRVDGLDGGEAPRATLHVQVDDLASEPVAVSTGSSDGGTAWTLTGSIPLGADLAAPQPATIRATVDLPEGGTSTTEIPITLGGQGRRTGDVWQLHATRAGPERLTSIATNLTIDATLEYAGVGLGNGLQYLVTQGTYAWTYGPTQSEGCLWLAAPASGPLTPTNTAGSFGLVFYDFGGSIRWNAEISFEGDQTARTIDCGKRGTTRDTIVASGDVVFPEPLTTGTLGADSDSGSYTDGGATVTWTITKVR